MAEDNTVEIPRVKLGNQGLEVSKLGFGCMGLTGVYNSPVADEDGISIIKDAFSKGITFFDTSDVYGPHLNEVLIGKALKQLLREKIQLATKFGITGTVDPPAIVIKGTPEYVRSACEASLKRLGVDYIDLYYQHRVDTSVPIEETIGELKKLVEEGKVKYIGLSEASPDTIRRAHAVHPITAVQMEWSLWTRDIEEEIIPLCRELGIGIVPYSPLGRGFFGGKAVLESVPANSFLASNPRFIGENLEKNKNIYNRIESLAKKHQYSPAQLALAWVLHRGDDVVPIPVTKPIFNCSHQAKRVPMYERNCFQPLQPPEPPPWQPQSTPRTTKAQHQIRRACILPCDKDPPLTETVGSGQPVYDFLGLSRRDLGVGHDYGGGLRWLWSGG